MYGRKCSYSLPAISADNRSESCCSYGAGGQDKGEPVARYSISVELELGASERINAICERLGMPKKTVIARMIDWFGHQSDEAQVVILNLVRPQSQAAFLRLLAKQAEKRAEEDHGPTK